MFGIGGGELIFIMFIALMLFGSDKIPDIARTMAKGLAQLKNATNDLKSEIHKGAEDNGLEQTFLDIKSNFADATSNINAEINKAKDNLLADNAVTTDKLKEDLEEITGPIKRQQ